MIQRTETIMTENCMTENCMTESCMTESGGTDRRGGGIRRRAIAGLASISLCLVALTGPAFAQAQNPLLPKNLSPWGMFLNADIVVKAVMIGLAFASLVTWTVWLAKTIELGSKKRLARRRLKILESGGGLVDAVRTCQADRDAVAQLILSTA